MFRVPDDIPRDVLQVCQRMYARGLVAGADGNVSVRVSKDLVLATPSGMSKGFVTAADLVWCDMAGKQLRGERRLTTEIKVHLAAYAAREDVCAVVHAHPPFATAFAVAGLTPSEQVMPEAYIAVGKVALAPYGTPSTDELAENLRPLLRDHDALLLANHGAMTIGRDVVGAYHRMEALEQLCRITLLARQLGNTNLLGAEELAKLEAIRSVYGADTRNVPCIHCGRSPQAAGTTPAAAPADTPADRPTGYIEPEVHWPGNPPVWERPDKSSSPSEAAVRDLARRALRTLDRT